MDADLPYQMESYQSHLLIKFEAGTLITPDIILSVLKQEFHLPKEDVVCDIWDLRGCSADKSIDASMMIQIVNYIKERFHPDLSHKKTAIIVDRDVAFGLTRMFQILSEDLPYDVEVFREPREATQWIVS